MTLLEHLPEGAKVAVIRLRSLGDCVLTTPALALLKKARPDLRIGVVAEAAFSPVFEGNAAVSEILAPTWQAVRRFKPLLCLNLHGGTRSQWMTALSGAKWRAGFAHHQTTLAYNMRIPRAQRVMGVRRTVHTAEHLASAVFALGVPLEDVPRAELFISEPSQNKEQSRYAVLHPFASSPEKTWSAEKFCELARYLKLWNIKPLFMGGPGDNLSQFAGNEIVQSSLARAKALLAKASVFIGNDSGPAHMAAAFEVPSVVMFSCSSPAIWGPWRTESEIIVAPEGLETVSVSRIVAALERLRMLKEAHA